MTCGEHAIPDACFGADPDMVWYKVHRRIQMWHVHRNEHITSLVDAAAILEKKTELSRSDGRSNGMDV